MSSNLKVNTILPSTGTNVAIGTAGGSVDFAGTLKVGIVTARDGQAASTAVYYGDGSNLTSLPSQLSISNNADNRVITGGSGTNLNGEATLTYNGTDTFELQPASATPAIFIGDSNRTGAGQGLAQFRGNWNGTTVARITFDTGSDTTNKDDGIIRFDTAPSGSLVERLRINSVGNMSLGGLDPVPTASYYNTASFHIHQTTNATNVGAQIHLTTANKGSAAGDGSQVSQYNGSLYINNQDDGNTYFYNNGSPTATIKANGSFGIGTQAPTDKLHVNGTTNLAGNSYLTNAYVSGGIYLGGSAAVNKLDDYEEGSFTPYPVNGWGILNGGATSGGSSAYRAEGKYVRIGALVYIYMTYAEGSSSGASFNGNRLLFYGLPFQCDGQYGSSNATGSNRLSHPIYGWGENLGGNGSNLFLRPDSNGITVAGCYVKTSGGVSDFTGTNLSNSGQIWFQGTYRIQGT